MKRLVAIRWFSWALYTSHDAAYCKVPKFSDTKKLCCNLPNIQREMPNLRIFCQNDANGIANNEDPDQIAPLIAVLSGSALFVPNYMSENLGSLR